MYTLCLLYLYIYISIYFICIYTIIHILKDIIEICVYKWIFVAFPNSYIHVHSSGVFGLYMFHTLHIVLVWRHLVELLPGPREVHLMGYIWDHFRVFHVALVNQNVVGGIDTGYDVLQMLFAGRHGVP